MSFAIDNRLRVLFSHPTAISAWRPLEMRIGQHASRDREDVACVYAEYERAPEEVKLDEPEAKQLHLGMVRALVRLK